MSLLVMIGCTAVAVRANDAALGSLSSGTGDKKKDKREHTAGRAQQSDVTDPVVKQSHACLTAIRISALSQVHALSALSADIPSAIGPGFSETLC